jgi:spore photoproduct lyase
MSRTLKYEHNKGSFLRKCPGSPGVRCCDYFIVSPGYGCPFKCSYCFMQAYSEEENIIVYSNQDDLINELKTFIESRKDSFTRIGTGEFLDSLALPDLDNINLRIVDLVKDNQKICFEFKTKSKRVEPFLTIPAPKNVVLGWSMNLDKYIKTEELGTASLSERIDAIKKVIAHGYKIAIHYDPMYMSDDTLDDYVQLTKLILDNVSYKNISWFSLGGFRYIEELKLSMLENYKTPPWYLSHEFVKCADGKYRYPRTLRLKFYNTLAETIFSYGKINLYMCMEHQDFWDNIKWSDSSILDNLHA